jgi:hypothetical protein
VPWLNECPGALQFLFWVVVIGGGGYSARMLNKLLHRERRRAVARERR